jgi:hypothetical protein
MAKDAEFKKEYLYVRKYRAELRRKIRNSRHQINVKSRGKICHVCGGLMVWCSSCKCWSQICCYDYGSCECS